MLASEARARTKANQNIALTISSAKIISDVEKDIEKATGTKSTLPSTCVRIPNCLDDELERIRNHFEGQGYKIIENTGYQDCTYYYVEW